MNRLSIDTLWTPDLLTMYGWWDATNATSVVSSGGVVSQWSDISGNSNHLVQNVGALQPATGTRNINGNNSIDFDGAGTGANGDHFDLTTQINVIGKEVYAVVLLDNGDSNNKIFGNSSGNVQVGVTPSPTSEQRLWQGADPWNGSSQGDQVSYGTPHILGWLAHTDSNPVSSNRKLSLDSQLFTSGTFKGTTNTMNLAEMGKGGFSPTLDGIIGEVFIVEQGDTAQRQRAEGYLAWKWGLSSLLDISHPYKNSRPTV